MGPALRGGISYLKSLSATGQRIAILITDGDPTSCSSGNTITDVIAAAKAGYTGSPKVTTYAIGVPGSTVANLSQVAYAGGGKRIASCIANTSTVSQACHYQIGVASMQADLLKALNDITGKSLTCVFKLPTSTGDAGVDLGAVNVDLTTSGGTSELGRDTSHTNGWDYTDGDTTITLYGPPCDAVMTDGTAKVDILLGCPTKTPQ
jgi:FlaG/FlaF family flagellin (archaellin)